MLKFYVELNVEIQYCLPNSRCVSSFSIGTEQGQSKINEAGLEGRISKNQKAKIEYYILTIRRN